MADTILHNSLGGSTNHALASFLFTNVATMEASVGYIATDVGKLAYCSTEEEFYILKTVAPLWVRYGSETFGASDSIEQHDEASVAQDDEFVVTHSVDSSNKRIVQVLTDESGDFKLAPVSDFKVTYTSTTQTTIKKLSSGTASNVKVNILL